MASEKDFMEIVNGSDESLSWHLEPKTAEIVAVCRCCGEEGRHTETELKSGHFSVTHEPGCLCDGFPDKQMAPREARWHHLARRISEIVHAEPDASLIESTVAFVAAVMVD